jgi:hypothetical protein
MEQVSRFAAFPFRLITPIRIVRWDRKSEAVLTMDEDFGPLLSAILRR